MAERAGFEPAVHLWGHTHDFQSCSFSRSDISPLILCYVITARRIVAFAGVLAGEKSFFGGSSIRFLVMTNQFSKNIYFWRREGDSNPRESCWPPNRFRVDPVTTTSVSLRYLIKTSIFTALPTRARMLPSFGEKIYSKFPRIHHLEFLRLFPPDD